MITVSDNDLRMLLLYVQATNGKVQGAKDDLRLNNRVRLASNTYKKLMKREDVRRLLSKGNEVVVAYK